MPRPLPPTRSFPASPLALLCLLASALTLGSAPSAFAADGPGWSDPQILTQSWEGFHSPSAVLFPDGGEAIAFAGGLVTHGGPASLLRERTTDGAVSELRVAGVDEAPRLFGSGSGFALAVFPDADGGRPAVRPAGGQFGAIGPVMPDLAPRASEFAVTGAGTIARVAPEQRDGERRLVVHLGLAGAGTIAPTVVGPVVGERVERAAIGLAESGEIILAWVEPAPEGVASIRVALGSAAGFAGPVVVDSGSSLGELSLAVDEHGAAALAWDRDGFSVTTTRRAGAEFGAPTELGQFGYPRGLRVAAGGGRAALVFREPAGDRPVLAVADLAAGDGFSDPTLLSGWQYASASVGVGIDGTTLVTWTGDKELTQGMWIRPDGTRETPRDVACDPRFTPDVIALAPGRRALLIGPNAYGDMVAVRYESPAVRAYPDCPGPDTRTPEQRAAAYPPPKLIVPAKLRLDRKGRFTVRVGLSIPSAVAVSGSVRLKGLRSKLGLKRFYVRVATPPGERVTLQVAGKEAQRLARRHRRGGKATLAVTVREFVGPRQGRTKIARVLVLARSR